MELFRLFGRIAVNNDEANQAIDDTTGRAEESEGKMTSAFKKIGAAVSAYFAADKIIQFGKDVVQTAAEVSAEASAFEQIMGSYSDNATAKMNAIADNTGMVATRLTPYMTSLTAKFKGLGYDITDATTLASSGLTLAADASAFWDMSLDESVSHLNSFVNGSYEGGEAIGLFANDTQMAMYAVEQGLIADTKAWANLDEATKQATRLEYAQNMQEASGAVGQAAKESDQYANSQANLTEKWRQFKAEIGEPLLENVVNPAIQTLGDLVDTASQKFQELQTWVSENKDELEDLKGTIETVANIVAVATSAFVGLKAGMAIQSAVQGFQSAQVAISLLSMEIGSANLAQAALNGTMTFGQTVVALLTGKITLAQLATGLWTKAQAAANAVMSANPIALVVMAIAALIAIIVLLVKNWDKVKEVAQKVWDKVKEIWGKVSEWFKTSVIDPLVNFFTELWQKITTIWDNIKNSISNAIENIKGFFSGLKTSIENIWNSIKEKVSEVWNSIVEVLSTVWETIKNVIKVALMFIVELVKSFFTLITLPFRFIWENCKEYVFAAFEWIKEKIETVLFAIKDFFITIWTAIKDFFTPILEAIKTVVLTVWNAIKDFFVTTFEAIKEKVTTIWNAIKDFFSTVFNAIKAIVSTVWNAIKTAIVTTITFIKEKVTTIFNAVKEKVTSIWNAIKEKIITPINDAKDKVVSKITDLKNKIESKINDLKNKVQTKFNEIKEKITQPIDKARELVKSGLDKIKGFFDKLKIKFPNIKLPHFSIKGEFSLDPPSVPKLNVEWYAKGGILNSPTAFGINPKTGKTMVGGEAGAEAVAPIDTLLDYIRTAVSEQNSNVEYLLEKLISMLAEFLPGIIKNANKKLVLSTGELVGALAPEIDDALGEINSRKGRGN